MIRPLSRTTRRARIGPTAWVLSVFLFALFATQGLALQAHNRVRPYALHGVKLSTEEGAEPVTLLLRDGRIEQILRGVADAEAVPPGYHRVDGDGLIAYPAFIDAYTRTGCATPEPVADVDDPVDVKADVRVDMREANRKGVQPAFRAVEALELEPDRADLYRKAGFGILHSCPGGQLLSGTSALVTLREAAARDTVVRPEVLAQGAFEATGAGFPSTLMGFHAQLRQFFEDARYHSLRTDRHQRGLPDPRPPYDVDLDAARPILERERRLLCRTASARDIERWLRLADEFGFEIAVGGGGEAWKLAGLLAELGIPVFLDLDWGEEEEDPHAEEEQEEEPEEGEPEEDEPEEEQPDAAASDDGEEEEEPEASEESRWEYEEPLGLREERRRLWEEKRDCALRLAEAGASFAFGSADGDPGDLLENVRALVESGLDRELALAALTSEAAGLFGVGDRLGAIQPGFDATLVLWTADPLSEDAEVAWVFVDGFPHEYEPGEEGDSEPPAEGLDVTGTWKLELKGGEYTPRQATAELEMAKDGSVKGTIEFEDVEDGSKRVANFKGRLSDRKLSLKGVFAFDDYSLDARLEADVEGDKLSGKARWELPWEKVKSTIKGTRVPEGGSR